MKRLVFIVIICICGIAISAHAQKRKTHKVEETVPEIIDSSAFFLDGFRVKNFHAEVNMRQDGYFTVTERYEIWFISQYKHGIIRTLPLRYIMSDTTGAEREYDIKIDSISVTGREFTQNTLAGELNIRIGDPYTYATGMQEYTISYRVKNAFFFNNGKPDFYWNFIGAGWNTIFERASFSIHLPVKVLLSPNDYYVYSGYYGDKAANACIAYEYGTIYGEVNGKMPQHYQLTVLAHLPQGYIYQPTAWDRNGWVSYPALLILLYVAAYFVLNRKKEKLLVVQVQPPTGMDPAMAGFIANNRSDASDIIALIPYWGAAGYITITQNGSEYNDDTVLTKIKSLPHGVADYELATFNAIFEQKNEVKIRDLEYVFNDKLLRAQGMLNSAAVNGGYFATAKPSKYGLRVFLFAALAGLGYVYLAGKYDVPAELVWVGVCCILGLIPWPTKMDDAPSDDRIQQLMGFKEFIARAEKDRLAELLKEDPNYFESTVGYAMAFGMLNDWGHKFDDMLVTMPAWYSNTGSYNVVGATQFTEQLGQSMLIVRTVFISVKPIERPVYTHHESYSSYSSSSSSSGYQHGGYSKSESSSSSSSSSSKSSSSSSSSSGSSSSSRGSGYSGGGFGGGGGGSW